MAVLSQIALVTRNRERFSTSSHSYPVCGKCWSTMKRNCFPKSWTRCVILNTLRFGQTKQFGARGKATLSMFFLGYYPQWCYTYTYIRVCIYTYVSMRIDLYLHIPCNRLLLKNVLTRRNIEIANFRLKRADMFRNISTTIIVVV